MGATKNCVVCFNPANSWGGHVHKNGDLIIAGTCADHYVKLGSKEGTLSINAVKNCKGCYGDWKEEMGFDPSFGQFGYIDREGFHELD